MAKYIKEIILAAIIVVLAVITALYLREENKEYNGGNILNFQHNRAGIDFEMYCPWLNNTIVSNLTHRTLFLPDHTLLEMQPDLANYKIHNDGMSYTINLKPGQKWSDGTEITMQDVIFSIEAVQVAEGARHIYKAAFAKIDRLEVDEDDVLTIYMKERTTLLRPALAQLAILPFHKLSAYPVERITTASEYWKNPTTSGLYRLDSSNEEYTLLVPNENYGGNKPQIDEIRLYPTSNNAMLSKIDYHTTSNVEEMVSLRSMQGFTEYSVDMNFYRYLIFNIEGKDGNKNPAMQDIRVRQAICMAIDRQKILRDVYYNMGNIVNGAGQIGILGPYNYNLEKAKELLAEANYDFSRPLRFTFSPLDNTSRNFLQQIKLQLEEVGFKVDLFPSQSFNALYQDREFDVMFKTLASFQPSEWYTEYHSSHSFLSNLFGGKGELDQLIDEVAGETNAEKHTLLMNELAREELDLLYKFPLFTLSQSAYINTARVAMPNDFKHGNFLYRFNMHFADWHIKKK